MLDLTAITRKLTQGQPPATMTAGKVLPSAARILASVISEAPGQSAVPVAPNAQAAVADGRTLAATAAGRALPSVAAVDPHAVARRVYELMCRELAVEKARCGRSTRGRADAVRPQEY